MPTMKQGTQLFLCGTVTLWSSALVGIRLGLAGGYSPGSLALLRYLIASLLLIIPYSQLPQRTIPNWRDALRIILIGTIGIGLYNLMLNYGETVVPASIAGFIIGLMPVFTLFFAFLIIKESIPRKIWWGIFTSLGGLLLIAVNERGGFAFDKGLLCILAAAMCGSFYAVAQKKLLLRYHPLELVILSIWGGTLILCLYFPQMLHDLPQASAQGTLAAIYLGIFPGAVAYTLWNYALSRTHAGRASGYLYTMPLITALLGAIILQEYPEPLELFGGLITLAGAVYIHFAYKQMRSR